MIGGFVLLVAGAESLIRGSSALALRLGLTPLVIGLTIIAFGTSSPELAVSIKAAMAGTADVSLGNVVGSNIANIALILGLSALMRPICIEIQIIRREIPILLGATLLCWLMVLGGNLARWEGLILCAGIVLYTGFSLRLARKTTQQEKDRTFSEIVPSAMKRTWQPVLMVIAGLAMLVVGAQLLVNQAVALAARLGLSEAVIALTIVALGTSLPELVTSVTAAFKGESDMAAGNVIGSNIFNILAILGISALVHPLAVEGIGWIDMGIMTACVLLILPLMYSGFTLNRWEGGLLLLGYVAYIFYLLP